MDRFESAFSMAGACLIAGGLVVGLADVALAQAKADQAAVGSAPDIAPPFCGCGKSRALWLRARAGLPVQDGEPAAVTREASTDTDLLSNDLDIEVTPTGTNAGMIAGSNTMRVRSLVNGLTQFTFRLRSPNFTVSSVTLNGVTPATASTPGSNSYGRTVTLDRPYNIGEEFTVRVAYSGIAVSRGFGSIAFTTQFNGGPAIAASLSEAYYGATWWPTKDGDVFLPGDNGDKATGSIAITAPSIYTSVSNGLLTSTTPVAGGKTKYRWTTNLQTAPYLFFFSTSVYNQWSQTYSYPLPGGGTGTMPVEFSIYPNDDTPANRAAWEKCLDVLAAYRQPYGEYPFVSEKYGMYEFPFGGGMEHQTYTGIGGFWESVVAHELAHQWWGDNVTCKTWNDIWLNEGFATYSEAIWEENKPGSSGQPALQAAMNARRPGAVNDSVYLYDTSNMTRMFSSDFTYDKGAWVLQALRHVVGDTTFFDILHQYRATYQGQGATTNNFRDVASSVSGIDLTNFFQQWVYGIGAPAYTAGFDTITISGQNYARLVINQTQDPAWGANSKFSMPIDVDVSTTSGVTRVVLQNTARTQHYLIPIQGSASSVVLDPQDWFLITSKTGTTYSNGPAKIIGTIPAADAALTQAPTLAKIKFSENVNAPSSAFTFTGPSGPVAFTYSYSAAKFESSLVPTGVLAPGTYHIDVADSVTTVASSMALDGEPVVGFYPTGDGLPGGAAHFSFTIQAPVCPADLDNGSGSGTSDGAVDINDLLYFLNQFESGGLGADLDNGSGSGTPDGGVDINDLLYFLAHFELGC